MQLRYLTRLLRSITIFSASVAVIFLSTILLNRRGLLSPANPKSFIIWLHGLGDSGPANKPIRTFFSSAEFKNTKWSFPSAPLSSVSCSDGAVMPSWFDIYEIPIGDATPKDERGLLIAVKNIHSMIDKEVTAGTSPENIFICGFSQGGALTLASALLYPKTLGGGAVFSGWVPFNRTIKEKVSPEARKAVSFSLLTDASHPSGNNVLRPQDLLGKGFLLSCLLPPQRHRCCGCTVWLTQLFYLRLVRRGHHLWKILACNVNSRLFQRLATLLDLKN